MASEGLGRGVHSVQPKDLQLAGGNWQHPTEAVPTAELISAISFNASGSVRINQSTKQAAVEFDLSKSNDSFGWEGASVRMRMILAGGREISHIVQPQINAMKANEKTLVRQVFQWRDRDLIRVLFVLSDGTSKSKGGLIIHGVTVREM